MAARRGPSTVPSGGSHAGGGGGGGGGAAAAGPLKIIQESTRGGMFWTRDTVALNNQ